ncbi:MAG: ATP-binding cassette domain-containing protein [Rickettsiales bacterium]|jgi:ATP-binding cassette subfamily F protein 3|nr:ATP-binding cassette domain-containing protein [Rickettsiales bacterium]
MIQVKNLSKSFGDSLILDNLNFSIANGDKVAVVGLNGAGKSTLFKIILDQIRPDDGSVDLGPAPRVGWMPQVIDELDLPDAICVRDFLRSARPMAEIERKIAAIYQNMAPPGANNAALLKELESAQSEFDRWGGYGAESELEKMIAQIGVSEEILAKNLGELSGGQKSKISFIRTLYSRPDILFLDEPTNHLDAASRDWVIGYLSSMPASVVFISHDEDFVRRIAKKVLYLDAMTRRASLYGFGYDRFLRTLAETNESLEKQMRNQMREISRIQQFIDSQKGKSGKRKRQAQSREKTLEKLKRGLAPPPKEKKVVRLELKPARTGDANPIIAQSVSFSYSPGGRKVINNLTFSLTKGERLIIVGENGAGKSTLLKLMAGALAPQSGKVTVGRKTDTGYYAQEHETLDKNATVLDNAERAANLPASKIRAFLGRFNFRDSKASQTAATLSPGERSRLELAKLCLGGANLLLLDEPTNHLDIPTKKSLAKSFREYGGTFVVVSHDVDFLGELGIERMLMLPAGKIRSYDESIVRRYMELEKQRKHESEKRWRKRPVCRSF